MAYIFMPHVTLSFVCLSRNTCNSDPLEIRRKSTMYLDFARRTQWYDPRRHPRSREIPRFATCAYHFTLSGVSHPSPLKRISSRNSHTHIHTITWICNSHLNAKWLNHVPPSSKRKGYLVCFVSSRFHVASSTPLCCHNTFTSLTVLYRKTCSRLSIILTGPSLKVPSASTTRLPQSTT